jgi:hypothetical protein
LALTFGLENIVDFISSAIVVWRFFAPGDLTPALEEKLHRREQRASIAISIILTILGIGVIIVAIDDFAKGEEELSSLQNTVVGVAALSIIVFGTFVAFKFQYSAKLDSQSLYKDGVCSLIGTIMAVAMFVNGLLLKVSTGFWWIDPIVALVAGLGAIWFGLLGPQESVFSSYKAGVPIFNMGWWSTQGDTGGDNKNIASTEVEVTSTEVV